MIDRNSRPTVPWHAFPRDKVPFCVFLDVDSMLLDDTSQPETIHVEGELIELLRRLEEACHGALALVSRHPITAIDLVFAPLQLPAAGISGAERRDARGAWHGMRNRQMEIIRVREPLAAIAKTFRGIFFEDKGDAFAFHFRHARHAEELLRLRLARALARTPDFEMRDGNACIEVTVANPNKGTAIRAFMREPPFAGCMPVCLGDGTDQDAFGAVKRMNGLAVAVGIRGQDSCSLPRVADVRSWLSTLARQAEAQ
jgi:trehalose 6-phosphate phosphatase